MSAFAEEILEPKHKISASSELKSSSKHYYGPRNLYGNDPEKAWCEGNPGNGNGEWIRVEFEGKPVRSNAKSLIVKILPGYGKSFDLFKQNARPSIIKAIIYYGKNKEVLLEKDLLIEDKLVLQKFEISLDRVLNLSDLSISFIIKEVYSGSKYEDMCVSEVTVQPLIIKDKIESRINGLEDSALMEIEIIKRNLTSARIGDDSAIQKLIRISIGEYFNTAEGGEWLSEIYLDLFIAHPYKFIFLLNKQEEDVFSKIAPILNHPQIEKYSEKIIKQAFIEAERQGADVGTIIKFRN